ncbi:MAG: 3-oxoadipate enol-lactonase [Burkholderiaceae bacterium]
MKVDVNGVGIHYEVLGEKGDWVTMSHSLCCNVHMWDGLAQELAQRHRVLRFDTRGHGQSDAPTGPYTLAELGADAYGLMQQLGIELSHWIGLSMGGMIGQTMALAYPGLFASMVLADTSAGYPAATQSAWGERMRMAREGGMQAVVPGTLARWFTEPFRQAQPEVMAKVTEMITTTPLPGYLGCCEAIAALDLLDRIHAIACPTLVVVGDQDGATTPDMARDIAARIAGAKLHVVPNASHIANMEQPANFNQAVHAFLASL